MALELKEVKAVQAERERRSKEQQQKIEKLSSMVINCAVDDRDINKRNVKVAHFLTSMLTLKCLFKCCKRRGIPCNLKS